VTRPSLLDGSALDTWLAEHRNWQCEDGHLVRHLRPRDYASGVRVVVAQVGIAEELDHHPRITVGYRELRVELWTHDLGGVTVRDLDYAGAFDELILRSFADALVD